MWSIRINKRMRRMKLHYFLYLGGKYKIFINIPYNNFDMIKIYGNTMLIPITYKSNN